MIIISGYAHANSAEERDAAVAAFSEMVMRARKQDGCIDLAITADSVDPTRSNIIEIWRDEQAWKAWQKLAKGPKTRPKAVNVSLYRTDSVKTLA